MSRNARPGGPGLMLAVLAACVCTPLAALPPAEIDPAALVRAGDPVTNIPAADSVSDFVPLDEEHVMLSTGSDKRYVLTLDRQCFGLRWARHVEVTTSDNTIWAGFDALTADGEACAIRTIHLVPDSRLDAL